MTDYRGSTCVSLGYRFNLTTPDAMPHELVEYMMESLVDYDDQPTNENLKELAHYITESEELDLEPMDIELLKYIDDCSIHSDICHRDPCLNELEKSE